MAPVLNFTLAISQTSCQGNNVMRPFLFGFTCVFFGVTGMAQPTPATPPAPAAQPAEAPKSTVEPWKLPKTLINRAVLTVEKRVYSLSDVYMLFALWNTANPDDAVATISDWANISGFQFDRSKPFLKQVEKWPHDVQKLFFIVMNYPELLRQPLGAPSETSKNELIAIALSEQNVKKLPANIKPFITTLHKENALILADMVLRATAHKSARGSLRENSGALNWFWHQRITDVEGRPN
jgi:hypothetical protein